MAVGVFPMHPRDEPPDIVSIASQHGFHAPSIPAPRTSFFGRRREIETVQELLNREDIAAVTLTGPGGVGKTRIAIQAITPPGDATSFVDLSDVQQSELVLPAIASALGVHTAGRSVLDSLESALRHGKYLLVLDNFEQVLPAAEALAGLLGACPRLKLLITSRAVLGIPGEHVVDIRPLPLPVVDQSALEQQAAAFDACRLFVDRAQALDPAFTLTRSNAEAVVDICRRLDGLPLAIELAAAWISVLTPRELLAQIEHRLDLLNIGPPGVDRRHRTMRNAIAWSYGLLGEESQRLFRQLAVFIGGFTLEAMRAVCDDGSPDVLQELRTLVANSLVRRVDLPNPDSRYMMLETVREFGLERLDTSGEAETIHARHAAYLLDLARRVESHVNTAERDVWLDRMESEQGNLHQALRAAIDRSDAEYALDVTGALLPYWQFRFHSSAGSDWLQQALALDVEVSAPVMRKALVCAGTLSYMNGDMPAAEGYLTDALNRYQDAGDPAAIGRIELSLGRIAWDRKALADARSWFDAARERFEQAHDQAGLAWSLHYLGLVAFTKGNNSSAANDLQQAAHIWQALGFGWELSCCIPGHLADVARASGNFDEAMTLYQTCLSINWERQDLENVAWSLVGLAIIAHADGLTGEAARLLALANQYRAITGAPLTPHIERDHRMATETIVSGIGQTEFEAIQDTVRAVGPSSEIADALALSRVAVPPGAALTALPPQLAKLGLTQRELEILRLLAAGKSNREIADILFISPGTVKVHVTHILAKLDLPSRSAATDYAHRHGLV
ncbi:MAG TPA: LuxR C-terminal-related transcriptional regulator [Thermomicrobiales bacterium]|nr:LuxR C-terminal-related transcriptional regulator [Thermomicrobiales bacterium]